MMNTVLSSHAGNTHEEHEEGKLIFTDWAPDQNETATDPDERLIPISDSRSEKKYITEAEFKTAVLYYIQHRGAGEAVQFMRDLLEGYYWPASCKEV